VLELVLFPRITTRTNTSSTDMLEGILPSLDFAPPYHVPSRNEVSSMFVLELHVIPVSSGLVLMLGVWNVIAITFGDGGSGGEVSCTLPGSSGGVFGGVKPCMFVMVSVC
jgi:hypothetical protein